MNKIPNEQKYFFFCFQITKQNKTKKPNEQKYIFFCFQITFKNEVGQYDLEVTTFQLAVLFAWNQRPREKISFENLKLATELPDAELRRTLWVFSLSVETDFFFTFI